MSIAGLERRRASSRSTLTRFRFLDNAPKVASRSTSGELLCLVADLHVGHLRIGGYQWRFQDGKGLLPMDLVID